MNIKGFGALISVLFTALAVYILYVCRGGIDLPVMIAGGVTILATSFMGMAVRVEPPRTGALNSVASWCFCAGFFALNILFALFGAGMPAILITNGLLLIIYLVVIRALIRARQ